VAPAGCAVLEPFRVLLGVLVIRSRARASRGEQVRKFVQLACVDIFDFGRRFDNVANAAYK
jgi:hypothetical protein